MDRENSKLPGDRSSLRGVRAIVGLLEALMRMQIEIREQLIVGSSHQHEYTCLDFARKARREPTTVQEWCRRGRINARKIDAAAGDKQQWRISHAELERYVAEGLLPENRDRNS